MTILKLLHSTVNEDLGCFQFGAIMNKAVLNTLIHAIWCMLGLISFGRYPEVEFWIMRQI